MNQIKQDLLIENIPNELESYGRTNYDKLYNLAPKNNGTVLIYDSANQQHIPKTIFRKYRSFLNIPQFDKNIKKSYMYADTITSELYTPLHELFVPYYNYAKQLDSRYNQAVINWYDNGNTFIEAHSDCGAKLIENYNILIFTINQLDTASRTMHFEKRDKTDNFSLKLISNEYITMSKSFNEKYRHRIDKEVDIKTSRISITFRQSK